MHFYVEVDEVEGFKMVRAHRTWFGKPPKDEGGKTFEKVEVPDYASDDPSVHVIALEADEAPEGPSAKMKNGLVLTAEPERYGDPDARLASGKKTATRLVFEEWVPLL